MPILKSSIWKRLEVQLQLKTRVVGGIPANPELIKGWVQKNMPSISEDEKSKLVEKTVEELGEVTEEKASGMWTTFKKNEKGIYLEGRCVKAMFKESANVLRDMLIKDERELSKDGKKPAEDKKKLKEVVETVLEATEDEPATKGKKKNGSAPSPAKSRFTNLKSRTAERLFVEQDHVFFFKNGQIVTEPDGNEERAIHVMTLMGPRTALKRYDYVEKPTIQLTLRYLRDGIIDRELIEVFLDYAGWNGLGADRSQGEGMFEVLSINDI